MVVKSEAFKKIDNMDEFADLFLSLYFMSEKNEHQMIKLSKEFKETLGIILEKYRDYFSDNMFDDNGKFKIDEFLSKMRYTKAKAYFKDNFKFDFISNCITTEVGIDSCNQILRKTDIDMRDITISNIISDFCISEAQFPYTLNERYINKNNKPMNDFATLFLSRYIISMTKDDEIVRFSKYFSEIIDDIMNKPVYKEFLLSNNLLNDKENFDLNEFLYAINHSRIKKFWASSWNFDIEDDIIFTSINKDVANIIYKSMSDDMSMHLYYIVKDYITEERKINANNKKYILE